MLGVPAWFYLLVLLVLLSGIGGGLSLAYHDRRSRRPQPPRMRTSAGVARAGSSQPTLPQSDLWDRVSRLPTGVWLFYDSRKSGSSDFYLRVTRVNAEEFAVERIIDFVFLARSTAFPLPVEVLTVTRSSIAVIARLIEVTVRLMFGDLVVDSAVIAQNRRSGESVRAGQLTSIELRAFSKQLGGARPLAD